jgi:hypothetical protein
VKVVVVEDQAMSLVGQRSRLVLESMVDILRDRLPDDVSVELVAVGKWTAIHVNGPLPQDRTLGPGDADYAKAARRFGLHGAEVTLHPVGSHTGSLVRGLGTWVPFVPRRQRARMAALDALELFSRSIADAIRGPWPCAGAEPFAAIHGDWVTIGFVIGDQRQVVGRLEITACL